MKKVKGMLSVRIWVDCPECAEQMDLMTDVDHANDEGQMLDLISKMGHEAWMNLGSEMECPHCKADFIFDELEY